ncbi:integrator complex subunit 3 [Phycomyces blakesleeanus]|uniref:Integrator complex subunit 3 n=1 Tax=Phycomyces blakesleeanus TaxID=4837 RepID=A0ABR3ASF5_PHYBL
MDQKAEFVSKLFECDELDLDDELELELSRLYALQCEATREMSEIELHNYLQDQASRSKKGYADNVSALLYGIITEPEKAQTHFQCLSFINRDNFSVALNRLHIWVNSIRFPQMKLPARDQILWFIGELTNLNVQTIDSIYLCLLRQIRGGDTSQSNVMLCDQMLRLCDLHKSQLDAYPRVIATAAYTFLRTLTDHRPSQLVALQQREIRFVVSLLREKWAACSTIGRDLVRVLHDVANIPAIGLLWDDILNNPQKLSPRFKGIESLLMTPTPKEFLRSRLAPDMETKLLYILQNLRLGLHQRNLNWFLQRYLSTPESEPFYADVIRYIVAGWYPSNQILQTDIVPRYVIIGSMIRAIKSTTVSANVKLALIYDWLFFKPTDNIMFIEPAVLLMEKSAERYPYITSIIMEFLKFSVDEYYPPLKEKMAQSVACSMKTSISKGVIR